MPIFTILQLNIVYGVIACLVAIGTRYGGAGDACAEKQDSRAFFLGLQVICLVLSIPFSCAHMIFMKIKGKEWCDAELMKEDDDDDE
jgi:hypothetical protein